VAPKDPDLELSGGRATSFLVSRSGSPPPGRTAAPTAANRGNSTGGRRTAAPTAANRGNSPGGRRTSLPTAAKRGNNTGRTRTATLVRNDFSAKCAKQGKNTGGCQCSANFIKRAIEAGMTAAPIRHKRRNILGG
jgi:hypothetical protein